MLDGNQDRDAQQSGQEFLVVERVAVALGGFDFAFKSMSLMSCKSLPYCFHWGNSFVPAERLINRHPRTYHGVTIGIRRRCDPPELRRKHARY